MYYVSQTLASIIVHGVQRRVPPRRTVVTDFNFCLVWREDGAMVICYRKRS